MISSHRYVLKRETVVEAEGDELGLTGQVAVGEVATIAGVHRKTCG